MTEPKPAGDLEVLECRVYTHARRHPMVIGNIQGIRIPPLTPAQLGVLVGSFVALVVARPLWAHLGAILNALVLLGVPVSLCWAMRAVRIEGRAPWRAGLGLLSLWCSPRCGMRLGRPHRDRRRPVRYRPRTWITERAEGSG